MESHEAQHGSDVCPVFPQRLHFYLFLELFLPPLPLKFLLPRPLLLHSPLEGSLDWSLPARAAPILDAKECIFNLEPATYRMLERKKMGCRIKILLLYKLQNDYAAYYK